MCTGKNTHKDSFTFNSLSLTNSREENTLGITNDNKLNFNNHVKNNCSKSSQKVSSLSRIAAQLDNDKRWLLLNRMIRSHFSQSSLIWMFRSKNGTT